MVEHTNTHEGLDRIKAWAEGLAELEERYRDGEEGAAQELRRQASAISAGAAEETLPDLEGPADAVVVADDETLSQAAERLTDALGELLDRQAGGRNEVAVCGFDREMAEELRRLLQAEGLRCLVSREPSEILALSSGENLAAVVLSLGDGHGAVRSASEQLEQTGTPVLVVGPERALHELDQSCLGASDATMPLEAGAQGVLRWVLKRQYGARETIRSVRRDRVTGLLNRAALIEQLVATQLVSRRTSEPITVAIIELQVAPTPLTELPDHAYVDVLLRVSSACSRTFRETDVIARTGGGRFAIMFPGETPEGCERAMARLIDLLENETVKMGEHELSLHAKAGVSQLSTVMRPESALDEAAALLKDIAADSGSRIGRWSADGEEGGRIVLLAKSKSPTASILFRLLSQEGYEVLRSGSGEGLGDLVAGEPVALAIVDEELGLEASEDLVRALRAEGATSGCPIVLLGRRGEEAAARVSAFSTMGNIDYIRRPFTVSQFLKRTKQLLGGQGVPVPADERKGCKLLLVDSHVGRLMLAANALHRTGAFEILMSRSAGDAMLRCQEDRPGAIFMVMDGGATGNELAQWLLQDGRLNEMRVAVAADGRSMRVADKMRYSGGAGVLELPYDAQVLPEKLAEMLEVDLSESANGGHVPLDKEIRRAMAAG